MKNKLLSAIVIAILVLPLASSAETGTSSANTERRDTIKSEIDARKESVKNSVEERREDAKERKGDRVERFARETLEKFGAAIRRLERLAERIDSRIAKMEERGIDTERAKELLAEARVKISTAKISVTDLASTTENISFGTTTSEVRESFGIVKKQIEKAKKDIKAAHAALVDVINNLKPGDNKLKNSPSATSTATTTEIED